MDFFSSKPRPLCVVATLLLLGAVGTVRFVYGQEAQTRGRQNATSNVSGEEQRPKTGELELLPVQGNISMLAGAGGNITVQAGKDGILLVDTGLATMSDKVLRGHPAVIERSGQLHHQYR